MRAFAAFVAGAMLCGVPSAQAEFDCAKAWLPVDHVICASPGLMQANDELAEAWTALRSRLDDAAGQQALAEQRQWIKAYPGRCGLPAKGKPPAARIKAAVPCIDQALRDRTDELHHRLAALAPPVQRAAGDWRLATSAGESSVLLTLEKGGAGQSEGQASFVVHHADGASWTFHTTLQAGKAQAMFPADFLAPHLAGSYRCEVLVDLQAAGAGAFTLK